MKIYIDRYPLKARELLEYMDIIRFAAKHHRQLGWLLYDYKFCNKIANDKSVSWGVIDSQLWMRIFTVFHSQLLNGYSMINGSVDKPLFNNGPSDNKIAAKRDVPCRNFNRGFPCKNIVALPTVVTEDNAGETIQETHAPSFLEVDQSQLLLLSTPVSQPARGASHTTEIFRSNVKTPVNIDRLKLELAEYPN